MFVLLPQYLSIDRIDFFLLICESIHNVVIAINLRIGYWLLTSAFCSTCRFWPVRWTCSRRSSIKPARRSTAALTRSTARVPRWRLKHSASCWWPVSPSRRVLLYFPNPSPAAPEGIDKDQATRFILRWASLSHQLRQQWDTCSQTCKNSCFKILYVIFVVASVSFRNTLTLFEHVDCEIVKMWQPIINQLFEKSTKPKTNYV